MTKRIHFCVSISGAMRNLNTREWKLIAKENNTNTKHLRNVLQRYLDEGKKVMPLDGNDVCEGFSYETGCPGHEVKD